MAQVFYLKSLAQYLVFSLYIVLVDHASDHHADKLIGVDLLHRNRFYRHTVAQNSDTVGDLVQLVYFMGYVNNADAFCLELLYKLEQDLDLML